jgi:hypothetical protein
MREIHRNRQRRDMRSWVGEHVGPRLAVTANVYLVGFFLCHACVPVDALVWQKAARPAIGDPCEGQA